MIEINVLPHFSIIFQSECLIGLLKSGVNVNVKTSKFQQTPLHIAAFGGQANILQKLLTSGADINARVCILQKFCLKMIINKLLELYDVKILLA